MSDDQAVLTEVRGRTLVITINRPDQRNAVNAATGLLIDAAWNTVSGSAPQATVKRSCNISMATFVWSRREPMCDAR